MMSYKDIRIYCILIVLGLLQHARAQDACTTEFLCSGVDLLIADPVQCSVYYRCTGGALERLTCPSGEEFDSVTKTCGRAGFVRCHQECAAGTGVRGVYEAASNPPSTLPPRAGQDDDPEAAPQVFFLDPCGDYTTQCKTVPTDNLPLLFAHPNDCTKYYMCKEGGFVDEETCGFGQTYEHTLQTCVPRAANSNCFLCPLTTPMTTPPPLEIDPCSSTLADDCSRSTGAFNFPDVANCDKYYSCDQGRLGSETCPGDTQYDSIVRGCVAEGALCQVCEDIRPTSQDITPTPMAPAFDPCSSNDRLTQQCRAMSDTHNISDIHDCSKYYECRGSKLSRRNCPAKTVFDGTTFQCVAEDAGECFDSSQCPANRINPCTLGEGEAIYDEDAAEEECQQLGYYTIFSDPEDCGRFYECKDGTVRGMSCPDNQQFDAVDGACVPVDIARCQLCINPCASDLNQACSELLYDVIDFPDVTDCASYYRCKGGSLESRSCNNQRFDYLQGRCRGRGSAECFTSQKCVGYVRTTTAEPTVVTTVTSEATMPTKTFPTRATIPPSSAPPTEEPPTTQPQTTKSPSLSSTVNDVTSTKKETVTTVGPTESLTTKDGGLRSQTRPPTEKTDGPVTSQSASSTIAGLSSPAADVTSEDERVTSPGATVPGTDPSITTATQSPSASASSQAASTLSPAITEGFTASSPGSGSTDGVLTTTSTTQAKPASTEVGATTVTGTASPSGVNTEVTTESTPELSTERPAATGTSGNGVTRELTSNPGLSTDANQGTTVELTTDTPLVSSSGESSAATSGQIVVTSARVSSDAGGDSTTVPQTTLESIPRVTTASVGISTRSVDESTVSPSPSSVASSTSPVGSDSTSLPPLTTVNSVITTQPESPTTHSLSQPSSTVTSKPATDSATHPITDSFTSESVSTTAGTSSTEVPAMSTTQIGSHAVTKSQNDLSTEGFVTSAMETSDYSATTEPDSTSFKPTSSDKILTSEPPLTTEKSATSQFMTSDPLTSESHVTSENRVTSEMPITSDEPMTSDIPATSQIPITSENAISTLEPTVSTTDPTLVSSYVSSLPATRVVPKSSTASSTSNTASFSTQQSSTSMTSDMAWSTTGSIETTTQAPVDPCYRREPCTPNTRVGDPEDCQKYFECEEPGLGKVNLGWKRRQCTQGMNFDTVENRCVVSSGPRINCQEPCPGVDHQLTNITVDFLEGSPAAFQCLFFQPMASTGVYKAPAVQWYLNGLRLSESSRIIIQSHGADFKGYHNFTLTLQPAYHPDSGKVDCVVEYGNRQVSRQSEEFAILARPVVDLSPRTLVAREGETYLLSCNASVPTYNGVQMPAPDAFRWYKDGAPVGDEYQILEIGSKSDLILLATDSAVFTCEAANRAGPSERKSCDVIVYPRINEGLMCPMDTVDGITWPKTPGGYTIRLACGYGKIGEITRTCERGDRMQVSDDEISSKPSNEGSWADPNDHSCVDEVVAETLNKVISIKEGVGLDNETYVTETVQTLAELTGEGYLMTPGNLNATVDIVEIFGGIRNDTDVDTKIMLEELQAMVDSVSNILDEMHSESWEVLQEEDDQRVTYLMRVVDIYGDVTAAQTIPSEPSINIVSKNLVMQIQCLPKNETRTIEFPDADMMSDDWSEGKPDQIKITKATLDQIKNRVPGSNLALSSAYYKTLSEVLPEGGFEAVSSRILSLSVFNLQDTTNLDPPIEMEMFIEDEYVDDENYTAVCGFWDYSYDFSGNWSTEGCVTFISDSRVKCECNHLTNFAILMTNTPPHGIHGQILGTITIVGLIISLVSLVLTVALYISMWNKVVKDRDDERHIKSHHAVVLMNLCIALFMANGLFLAGVNRVENEMACTIIAALLHYFYLAAFFIMLVEGIQLMLYVVFVFHVRRKRETVMLLICGWFLPAGVVGASIGITRLEGYGNEDFCWLDITSPLKWAFIGPVLLIILINIIILIIVLKRAANSSNSGLRADKEKKSRIRAAVWNIVVITPIIGVAWLFGVFAVNEDTVAFQYIFTIFNSLQGLLIFIFHGVCNRRVRDKIHNKFQSSTPYTNTISQAFRSMLPGKVVPNAPCFAKKSNKTEKGKYSVKTPSTKATKRSRLKSDTSGKSGRSKHSKDSGKGSSVPSTPGFEPPSIYPMMSEKEKVNMMDPMEALREDKHMSWRNSNTQYINGTTSFNGPSSPESVLTTSSLSNGFSSHTTDTDCTSSLMDSSVPNPNPDPNYFPPPPPPVDNNIPSKEPVRPVLSSTSC